MAAAGREVHGEADLVMEYAPRSALDAGCGTGRVAIELSRRGVHTVGVDLDADFINAARRKSPGTEFHHADLAICELGQKFDVVVLAGNVMIFLAPDSEAAVLANLARQLVAGGRLIAGFQLARTDRGRSPLSLDRFDELARSADLYLADRFATWTRDEYIGGDYAVSVLVRGSTRGGSSHVA